MLDAALIADGAGVLALSELRKHGYQFFTSEKARDEALQRLADFRGDLSPIDDLLTEFIKQLVNVRSGSAEASGIAAHDMHLASVAGDLNACVLSEDLALIHDLNSIGMHGRTLREVLYAGDKPEPILPAPFSGTGFGADGHIFLKGEAHPDVLKSERQWNLFEVRNLGRLAYDGQTASFCLFGSNDAVIAKVPYDLRADVVFAALLDYSTGPKTHYNLKICTEGTDTVALGEGETEPLAAPPPPEVRWLNRYDKPEGWKGFIQVGTFGPYRLGRKTWRACRRLVGVAPSSMTADLSFAAALLCELDGARVRRPRLQEVVQLAHLSIGGFYPGSRHREREDKWFGE
jgi:hypothetical protein